MATQTPITLSKILSQTWRVIAAHPRHFLALSALFLLPISISTVLYYPFVVSQLPPPPSLSTPPKPQLLPLLIYTLSTLLFSLCAGSSITYSTFVAYHNKPVELIPSLQSILVSFFPLLATRFLTMVIIWLITFAFVVLAMLAGMVAYTGLVMFGFDMDYDPRYYLILVIVFTAIMMMGLIYLQIKWCLSTAVVVLESKWGYAPLKRSSYLVQGTKKVVLGFLLLFGSIGWGLSMWYFNVMASRSRGGVSKGWFCVEMAVYVFFATVLSLYAMVGNTVLFINCKALREEMAVVVIDEEIGGEHVALLKA